MRQRKWRKSATHCTSLQQLATGYWSSGGAC